MNINFGLLEPLPGKKIKKKERNILYADRALRSVQKWINDRDSSLKEII
jgi:folate-dependent tRNA-U54 methylase TrmFO/GidA